MNNNYQEHGDSIGQWAVGVKVIALATERRTLLLIKASCLEFRTMLRRKRFPERTASNKIA